MAKFVPGTDTKVEAPEPLLDVQVAANAPLKVGKHVFQLIVRDDTGNESAPATVTIIVEDQERPTAVIDTIDPAGARNPEPEVKIPFGRAFVLTGERSSDVGGEVKLWRWELLQA
ncbi:MAG TPA: hypothetical protein VFS42_03990 [Burkholderiaceae bacterium]|nr:hypothetical protein [Burkholderiaceae bacterium]